MRAFLGAVGGKTSASTAAGSSASLGGGYPDSHAPVGSFGAVPVGSACSVASMQSVESLGCGNAERLSRQYFEHNRVEIGQALEDGFLDAGLGCDPTLPLATASATAVVVDRRRDSVLERFVERCRKKLRKAKDEPTRAMVLALLVSDSCGRSGVHASDLERRHEKVLRLHRDSNTGELLIGALLADGDQSSPSKARGRQAPTGAALPPHRALLFKALADWLLVFDCALERRPAATTRGAVAATWNLVQVGQTPCVVDLIFDPGALYEEHSQKANEYKRLLEEADANAAAVAAAIASGSSVVEQRPAPPEPPSARKELSGHMPRPAWHVEPWELEVRRAERIGRGGFGEVFHARWEGMHVAVKEIKDTTPTDAEVVDFTLEIALLSQLNHPNIVRFWRGSTEVRNGSRSLLMVTEFIKQGGLSRWLHGHGGSALPDPLTLPQALSFALDIARGVQYLHGQRILHLDLKSPNVLCAPPWTAKLCDFGLAKIRGEQTMVQSTLQGVSPVWAPPEMFDDRAGGLTEKADVYSFAIIFFELLTKRVPFQEVPASQLPSVKVAGQLPRIPSSVPEDCAALIRQCCAARPVSRPSMSGVVARLREISQSRGLKLVEVKPPPGLLKIDCAHQQWIREAEEAAAKKLVELDGQRLQMRAELSELQSRIERVRRRGHELSAKVSGGDAAGDASSSAAAQAVGSGSALGSASSLSSGGQVGSVGSLRNLGVDDSWCEAFIVEVAGAKYRCALCSKLFRGPEFARRHVASKHQAEARKVAEDAYFDCDVSREDSLPAHKAILAVPVPTSADVSPVATPVPSAVSVASAAAVAGALAAGAGARFSQVLQDAAERGDAPKVEALLDSHADPCQQDDGGSGPLTLAAGAGHVAVLSVLLAALRGGSGPGVVVALRSATGAGLTPLHAAAQNGKHEAVDFLLQGQADLMAPCSRGKTPLLIAGENGHGDVCDQLLNARADVAAKTPEGETLLHVVARCGDADLIARIVGRRADLAAEDRDGWTPLHEAAHWGAAAVEELCRARANVAVRSRDGETPLHVAMEGYEQAGVCQALLRWGADPLAPDIDGETPLHVAVRRGTSEACHVLLQGGAEVNAVDHAGRTPLDLAARDDIRYLLASAGATRGHTTAAGGGDR